MGIHTNKFNGKYRITVHETWDIKTKEEALGVYNTLFNYKTRYGELDDFVPPERNTVTGLSKSTEPERNSVTQPKSNKT